MKEVEKKRERKREIAISAITANVGNDPVRHGDADYGGDVRKKEQYSRDDSQLVHLSRSQYSRQSKLR